MAKRGGGAVPLAELMKAKKGRPDDDEEEDEEEDEEDDEMHGEAKNGGDNEPELEAELQAIDAVQGELAELDDKMADEVLQVTRKYAKLKRPVLARRQAAIDAVPEFWFRVLLAHEQIGSTVSDLDQGPLSYLTRLEVAEVEGTQQDYRVDFHFSENPYFGNAVLWKQFEFGPDEARVLSCAVEWKDTPEARELQATLVPHLLTLDPVPDDVQPSFFSIFHPEDRDFQLGDTLKHEVWANPLAIYMSADFEEEDGDGGDGGEGDDDDEGEGEEEEAEAEAEEEGGEGGGGE